MAARHLTVPLIEKTELVCMSFDNIAHECMRAPAPHTYTEISMYRTKTLGRCWLEMERE